MILPDIQDSRDERGIPIDRVGIDDLRYPLRFDDGEISQSSVAVAEVSVGLPADRRGTHMSRMVQFVDAIAARVDPRDLSGALKSASTLLDADDVRLCLDFPVALQVRAPVSELASQQVIDVRLEARWNPDASTLRTTVTTEVTALCPCSLAVSDYGAHNQRSRVSVGADGFGDGPYPASVARLAEIIWASGSAPVLPVVKREDERHLTMQAFDTPVFVEDIVRDISVALRSDGIPHVVTSRNLESIHSHDAVATLEWRG